MSGRIDEVDADACNYSAHVVMGMTGAHVLCELQPGHDGLHHGTDGGNTEQGSFAEVRWEGGIAPAEGIEMTVEIYDVGERSLGYDYSITRIDARSEVAS